MGIYSITKLLIFSILLKGSLEDDNCRDVFKERYIPQFGKGVKRFDLQVTYDKTIKCGDTVSLAHARFAPTLKLDLTDRCVNVTVIEFTPDSTVFSPYLRWIAHNVPSTALKKGFRNGGGALDTLHGHNQGDIKCPYQTPVDPLAGSGTRNDTVIIFIYCQCSYVSKLRLCIETDRQEFKLKEYVKKLGMGCPVAGFYNYNSITGVPIPPVVKVDKVDVPVKLPKEKLPVDAPSQPDIPYKVPESKIPPIVP